MPSTDETGGWLDLLRTLDDGELQRFGEIAADQRRLEWGYAWLQVASALGAVAALGWAAVVVWTDGVGRQGGLLIALAAALAYWPYRKAVVRRLWSRHCAAVRQEALTRKDRRDRSSATD